jgi:N-acetyl-alpha-D-muramate 1-phosphate uridylyltransferase
MVRKERFCGADRVSQIKTAPKTAMVFAAGLGTRMRPLTNDRPKALVEVGGRTLIDHMLDRLKAAGVERFVVNVHYFAHRLEAHLKTRTDIEIIISDEREQLLETGGGLKKARPLLGEEPIFVVNTDSVWLEDVEVLGLAPEAIDALVTAWNTGQWEAALMLAKLERSMGFDAPGDFFMDEAGALAFRNEAPVAPFAYMGVHITRPAIIDGIAEDAFSLSKLWREKAAKGLLGGAVMQGEWMHVGDPVARDEADAKLTAGLKSA